MDSVSPSFQTDRSCFTTKANLFWHPRQVAKEPTSIRLFLFPNSLSKITTPRTQAGEGGWGLLNFKSAVRYANRAASDRDLAVRWGGREVNSYLRHHQETFRHFTKLDLRIKWQQWGILQSGHLKQRDWGNENILCFVKSLWLLQYLSMILVCIYLMTNEINIFPYMFYI